MSGAHGIGSKFQIVQAAKQRPLFVGRQQIDFTQTGEMCGQVLGGHAGTLRGYAHQGLIRLASVTR